VKAYANAVMEYWRLQYYQEEHKEHFPSRPPAVKDLIDQKKKTSMEDDNAAFIDRGIGTMCDTIDDAAIDNMIKSLWCTGDVEIGLR
jgi:hypothetical protein